MIDVTREPLHLLCAHCGAAFIALPGEPETDYCPDSREQGFTGLAPEPVLEAEQLEMDLDPVIERRRETTRQWKRAYWEQKAAKRAAERATV